MKIWRKVFSVALSAAILICSTPFEMINPVKAENFNLYAAATTDFDYDFLDDGTIEITKWKGSTIGALTIPDTFNEKKISSIGRFAFYNLKGITTVSIPDTITNIGEYAFSGCESLKEILIPDSVTTLQANVFAGCEDLKKVVLSDNLKSVPEWAFSYCNSLTEIEVPESVTKIGSCAFIECTNLKTIKILNASCDIYDDADTISSTAKILGYLGSSAQKYSFKYNRAFIEISPQTPTTTTALVTTTPKSTTSTKPVTTTTKATTTTKKTITTTTTINVTTTKTTIITTTTTVPTTSVSFKTGSNNWKFSNSSDNFGYSYYMNSKYWNALLDGLSNSEKEIMEEEIQNEEWGGSCYGMAVTSILSCYDILKPNVYQGNAKVLHDISAPPSEEVLSLINYYYAIQMTDVIQQEVCKYFYNENESEKLQSLISCLEDGSPTLLCFHGYFYGYQPGGHAVVAYDLEYGSYSYNGQKYDGKIIVYDNNAVDYDPNYCLYFNKKDGSWYIPHYKLDSNYNALLGLITDDLNLINYHGYLKGTSVDCKDNYIAVLRSAALGNNYNLSKVKHTNGIWSNMTTSEDEIKMFSSFTDSDFGNGKIKFALKDSKSGYIMKTEDNEELDLSITYGHL